MAACAGALAASSSNVEGMGVKTALRLAERAAADAEDYEDGGREQLEALRAVLSDWEADLKLSREVCGVF